MAKALKASSEKHVVKGSPVATKVVRDAKTGQYVTVKGVGALEGSDFKIKKGVSLLKPIAKQALGQRSKKRKAG
jgi:PIN domain nuclease of toxin-antitoxin system